MILLAALLMTATAAPSPACQVWQREQAFARSVRSHDAAAFRTFLADDAVFDVNGAHPVRGAAAIAAAWAPIVAGKAVQLDWQPAHVVLSADGRLALSSGPYVLTTHGKDETAHTSLGHFSTLWRRGRDGAWRVQFDGGDEGRLAAAAELAAFARGVDAQCPPGL
ncbi:nuclear transport factor 2 family protein [Dyella sp.]|jgi:uncharacterized protein (TIGR02246 family)|uniref:YybH family protein n=1 Tax=Dyella sp. TaxID=1869338 RepID=UPI002D77BED7|nr:nuclear transport factor 2 family protein [Dyella sp.]HET6432641.1 nuclear transport factor 2 family protein [Dyella sp.]